MQTSFYWHDYETTGIDYAWDRPIQFAGLRTDADLNEIEPPLELYCQLSIDVLPHPQSTLITGITPQETLKRGLLECDFAKEIHKAFATPATCRIGFNNSGFDDHITRFMLHRNFFAPYACEYSNNNSRWDLLPLARACGALRPEGLEWPKKDNKPVYSLEALTKANGIAHANAHDALADVRATVDLARLIKQHQPKLFGYAFSGRNLKQHVDKLLSNDLSPILHVAASYGNARYCTALVLPLLRHPLNNNQVLVWDLSIDPRTLIEADDDLLHKVVADNRLARDHGLHTLPLNRCAFIAPPSILDETITERIQLSSKDCDHHLEYFKGAIVEFKDKLQRSYKHLTDSARSEKLSPQSDNLYAVPQSDRSDGPLMEKLRACTPENLGQENFQFKTKHLNELLFLYRARNYPDYLNDDEKIRWQDYRTKKLKDGVFTDAMDLSTYLKCLSELRADTRYGAREQPLFDALEKWAHIICN